MTRIEIETSLGPVWFWREREPSGGIAIVAIAGAYAVERPVLARLQPYLDADLHFAHLPGNHSPVLAETSIAAFGAAFGEAIDRLERPVVLVGESVGALAALAVRSTAVRALVLLEPPLVTTGLEALAERVRATRHEPMVSEVLGFGETAAPGRDYRALVEGIEVPTTVFLGDPAATAGLTSLVRAPERELLARRARCLTVAGADHDVARAASKAICDLLNGLTGAL